MAAIQNAAYRASAELAAEKGAFPLYDAEAFLARPNVARLDADVRAAIAKNGVRNGCLTSIAPTGTISLLAGNVSSGIEPVFDFTYRRRVLQNEGRHTEEVVEDLAHHRFRAVSPDAPLPPAFVRAGDLAPADHLAMQAALQPYVDSAISKTINCPEAITFEDFRSVYTQAYDLGLKGCTTYRPNPVTGAVLMAGAPPGTVVPAALPEPTAAPAAEDEAALSGSTLRPVRDPILRFEAEGATGSRSRDVVYLSKPLERDSALEGVTYKIKWPASPHALYVTINDIERDGRRRPFEIFINTKNLEHYAWTVALTRMISAVFRRGGDVSFVAEELKAVFDPEGGRWMGGRYVPSLLAAIGDVIEEHMIRIGFLIPDGSEATGKGNERAAKAATGVETQALLAGEAQAPLGAASEVRNGAPGTGATRAGGPGLGPHPSGASAPSAGIMARICPRCGSRSLMRIEGCWTCTSCHYSHCG
jgi:ribonucleoside-diphosphate reductase alpha chain